MADLRHLPLDQIDVPRARIRRDLGHIEDLAVSLDSFGLLHPVHVYKSRGRFRLVAGERRLEAARKLGWSTIDAMVREPDENDLLLELVENTQRKWLSDAEEADALIKLVREMGCEMKEVAAQAGRSEAYVSKRVRVFEDPVLRRAVEGNQLPVSVAEEFLGLPLEKRSAWVQRAVEGGWEGRRVRDAIRAAALLEAQAPVSSLKPSATCPGTKEQERLSLPAAPPRERPSDLTQQIRSLERALRDLRPFQLTRADEKVLADLLETLLRLARAHAGRGRLGPIFPSIEEAEQAVRRR
ncbi:MAG TPA: ParB/RepB/Spo0J family partition protein [Chloroflexota bacterium]|nr:ParB/RepB/Spo0J family partition protein [Chloroflexota bacterium]